MKFAKIFLFALWIAQILSRNHFRRTKETCEKKCKDFCRTRYQVSNGYLQGDRACYCPKDRHIYSYHFQENECTKS